MFLENMEIGDTLFHELRTYESSRVRPKFTIGAKDSVTSELVSVD